jgi:hypothetical protein
MVRRFILHNIPSEHTVGVWQGIIGAGGRLWEQSFC